MNEKVQKEVQELIKQYLNCSVGEFKDKANWYYVSHSLQLSEDFIKEFKDRVDWGYVSRYQHLSEPFIREFQDKVCWFYASCYQTFSEPFIREFKDEVWWYSISKFQTLSPAFRKEFKDKINLRLYKKVHKTKTLKQKQQEVKEYAKKHKLKVKNGYLYAFRNHDRLGRGVYNKTISYQKGQYYKDWHCDMRKDEDNSFGLGIWPKGNTPVRVKIEDWGTEVEYKNDGKARVWGFELL